VPMADDLIPVCSMESDNHQRLIEKIAL